MRYLLVRVMGFIGFFVISLAIFYFSHYVLIDHHLSSPFSAQLPSPPTERLSAEEFRLNKEKFEEELARNRRQIMNSPSPIAEQDRSMILSRAKLVHLILCIIVIFVFLKIKVYWVVWSLILSSCFVLLIVS